MNDETNQNIEEVTNDNVISEEEEKYLNKHANFVGITCIISIILSILIIVWAYNHAIDALDEARNGRMEFFGPIYNLMMYVSAIGSVPFVFWSVSSVWITFAILCRFNDYFIRLPKKKKLLWCLVPIGFVILAVIGRYLYFWLMYI